MAKTSDGKKTGSISEHGIIEAYFAPLARSAPGAFDLLDDAALIQPAPGWDLVLTTDVIVSGIHFFSDDTPENVAYKALAVNLSDLAGKGATPKGYLLSLALPLPADEVWLASFASGLAHLQQKTNCVLMGGDTVAIPGPLTISITAFGDVPSGKIVKRGGASPGDLVYVSGTIGDAWLGLKLKQGANFREDDAQGREQKAWLIDRYLRPEPRLELATLLIEYASAAMDVSDGLVGDFMKLCEASGTGGVIEMQRIPLSKAGVAILNSGQVNLENLVTGGDDYEILMTIPEDRVMAFEAAIRQTEVSVTQIGYVRPAEERIEFRGKDNQPIRFQKGGYSHF